MRRNRNAKIIATLGPASATLEVIQSLFETGADVFRLNYAFQVAANGQATCQAG